MDGVMFGSPTKKAANTLDQPGFGGKPPERSKQVKQQIGRTSLFGMEANSISPVSAKKSLNPGQNSFVARANGVFGAENDGFGQKNKTKGASKVQKETSPFAVDREINFDAP